MQMLSPAASFVLATLVSSATGQNSSLAGCPRYAVASGRGGSGSTEFRNATTLAALTCCSDRRISGFSQPNSNCPVYAERDAGVLRCLNTVTWTRAAQVCAAVGARLCNITELESRCGSGTGCNHDRRQIWSDTLDGLCLLQGQSPTRSPTVASAAPTTPAPTLANNCPGYRIQSGAGGVRGAQNDVPRYAGPSELHEVQCCSDTRIRGFQAPANGCPVYAERDGGALTCLANANYTYAAAFCNRVGARLCNMTEVIIGCGEGTGCNFNSRMVWTSTQNPRCGVTRAPSTPAPTQVPTQANNCPGYRIQSGEGGTLGINGDNPRYASPSEMHAVSCCSDTQITGFALPGADARTINCTVYAERDGGLLTCQHSANWSTAFAACAAAGARLCTRQELVNRCASYTGCGFNGEMVWSGSANPNCGLPPSTFPPTTQVPTASPTFFNNCPGYAIRSGLGGLNRSVAAFPGGPTDGPRYAGVSERHEVTCCSDTAIEGFLPPSISGSCPVYAERDVGASCLTGATFAEATQYCQLVGARLCTAAELEASCGFGTGCGHNRDMIWSSTANPFCGTGNSAPTPPPTTAAPSSSPTSANNCPGRRIVGGRGGLGGQGGDRSRFAALSETHEVTCCSDTPLPGFVAPNASYQAECPVYAERDGAIFNSFNGTVVRGVRVNLSSTGCLESATFYQAEQYCASAGARLCNADELQRYCGRTTGCSHDTDMIWSSTQNYNCPGAGTAPPTFAPTNFPTFAPTLSNSCPGYAIRAGNCNEENASVSCTRGNGGDVPRYADPAERHEVTCCSTTSISGWQEPRCNGSNQSTGCRNSGNNCPVWAERDGGGIGQCYSSQNYSEASDICVSAGGRLCSAQELSQGCGQGRGCQFDSQMVWSNSQNPYCNGVTASPTLTPTTVSPTVANSCPGYRVQAGQGGPGFSDRGDQPRYADINQQHGITCCSDSNITGFSPPVLDCPVYSGRTTADMPCTGAATWPIAYGQCASVGARLCTAAELIIGCGSGLGCGYNSIMVWSSTYNPLCGIPQNFPPTTLITGAPVTGMPVARVPTAAPSNTVSQTPTSAPPTLTPTTVSPTPSTTAPAILPAETQAPVNGNSASTSDSPGGGGSSSILYIVLVVVVLALLIAAAVLYKKKVGGKDDHSVMHQDRPEVGFSNPLYQDDSINPDDSTGYMDLPAEGADEGAYMDLPAADDAYEDSYMDLPAADNIAGDGAYMDLPAAEETAESGYMDVDESTNMDEDDY